MGGCYVMLGWFFFVLDVDGWKLLINGRDVGDRRCYKLYFFYDWDYSIIFVIGGFLGVGENMVKNENRDMMVIFFFLKL